MKQQFDCKDVIAVVVTYNRPAELWLVIVALLEQTHPIEKVLVLDNAGLTPATDTLWPLPERVEIIRMDTNLGGAGGFAKGLELAIEEDARWIWLMDDDAIPQANALENLLTQPESNLVNIGALCCSVEEDGQTAVMHRRIFDNLLGLEFPISLSCYSKRVIPIDMGSFVGFLVSAQAVRSVGYPLAEMFLAYDDSEYSLRLRRAGYSLWLVPNSLIIHLRNSQSRLSTSEFGVKHYYNIRNRIYVKYRFAHLGFLAALVGFIPAIVLWHQAPKRNLWASFCVLARALKDGLLLKLGEF